MKLSAKRRPRAHQRTGVVGPARLDRRTRHLAHRLRPGDVAVIDHVDLDRASAESLVEARVAAVVNASQSISGRYPNLGPQIIAKAGIPLVDAVGREAFGSLREGDLVTVADGVVSVDGQPVAEGEVLDTDAVLDRMERARSGLSAQLEAFTANAMEYLRRERDLLLDGVGVPSVRTPLENRHVVVVVPGFGHREDLARLRRYMGDYRPVLVGVDGGADALVQAGFTPDLVVGDMESVSDSALRAAREVVVRAHRDGHAPGLDRLERLGIEAVTFATSGTSEDAALLLADSLGASMIVAVGTRTSLVEFLDQGRSGMASTFLTRLRVGPKLVDAAGVLRLYRTRIRTWQLLVMLLAGLAAVAVAIAATPVGQSWVDVLGGRWDDLVQWIQGLGT